MALFRVRVDPLTTRGHIMSVNATIFATGGELLRIAGPLLECIDGASDPYSLPSTVRRDKNLALYRQAVLRGMRWH